MTGHVALIGKARICRSTCERCAREQLAPHRIEPSHREVAIRTRAVEGAEIVREAPAVTPRRYFHFFQRDHAREVRAQKIASTASCQMIPFTPLLLHARGRGERMRKPSKRITLFQWFVNMAYALQQRFCCCRDMWICCHAAFDERKRPATQHILEKCGLHVNHAIPKALVRTRLAIMRFVGV